MLGGAIFVCIDWLNLALERDRPFASALSGEDSLSKMTPSENELRGSGSSCAWLRLSSLVGGTNFPREYGISKGRFDELVNGNSLPGAVRGGT